VFTRTTYLSSITTIYWLTTTHCKIISPAFQTVFCNILGLGWMICTNTSILQQICASTTHCAIESHSAVVVVSNSFSWNLTSKTCVHLLHVGARSLKLELQQPNSFKTQQKGTRNSQDTVDNKSCSLCFHESESSAGRRKKFLVQIHWILVLKAFSRCYVYRKLNHNHSPASKSCVQISKWFPTSKSVRRPHDSEVRNMRTIGV
jgi:hypothetical protein